MALVTFDVIPEEVYSPLQEYLIDLQSDIVYHQQIANAGYESGFILISMFLVFLFQFLFFFKSFVEWIIVRYFKKVKCCRKRVKKSKQNL